MYGLSSRGLSGYVALVKLLGFRRSVRLLAREVQCLRDRGIMLPPNALREHLKRMDR